MDRAERVIYVGSVSNLLAPGLRMGYIVVPKDLTAAFLVMGASLISIMGQLILARFIADGRLSSHLHRMRSVHSRRRTVLIEAIACHAADVLRVGNTPQAGMRSLPISPPAAAMSLWRAVPSRSACISIPYRPATRDRRQNRD